MLFCFWCICKGAFLQNDNLQNLNLCASTSLVANSSAMKSVQSLLVHLSTNFMPVLFVGEKGSGRSFCAQILHNLSVAHFCTDANALQNGASTTVAGTQNATQTSTSAQNATQSNKPFLRIHCPSIDLMTLKSILHADKNFCQNNFCTLFFDEIDLLPIEHQNILANFLQNAKNNQNLRICASTTKKIEELVNAGTFLQSLYYQLALLPVRVPALRERKEDIIALAEIFIKEYGALYNKEFTAIAPSTQKALLNEFWQENVSELAKCINLACKTCIAPVLEIHSLRLNISPLSDILYSNNKSLKSAVDRFKKQYIEQILLETRWNQTEAARILDIQRTYLSRLMRELDIK